MAVDLPTDYFASNAASQWDGAGQWYIACMTQGGPGGCAVFKYMGAGGWLEVLRVPPPRGYYFVDFTISHNGKGKLICRSQGKNEVHGWDIPGWVLRS
jgi:hypothetical protein